MTQFNQIDFDVPSSRNTSEFLVEDEEKERSLSSTEVHVVRSFVRFFFFREKNVAIRHRRVRILLSRDLLLVCMDVVLFS